MLYNNIGLVLEGGGMRGVFTCGVLDYFMDNNIYFPYAIGVSAGACNGLPFMSRQRGRAKYSNIDLLAKYNYIGIRHFIKKRNIMDFDLLFDKFPNSIIPYDYDAYARSPHRFEMVTSNCLTGEANYFDEKLNPQRIIDIVKASSSLPLMCPISYIDNIPMLDGGITDSIPVKRATSEGFEKNVVILTRNKGYRKEGKDATIPPFIYRKYPQMRSALSKRNSLYNAQLDMVDALESEGKVFVIRPINPLTVDRIEKNTHKLLNLYNEGYACGRSIADIKFKE